ncbi:MAG: BamA/TamA family outer membrane protein [Bacteroidales bacterium]|nr:BamA/TamA family outer membrane protein [Bacteroidales bacterium]
MKNIAVKLFLPIFALMAAFAVDASAKICISNISINGNKITKNSVILREIPMKVGTYISLEGLEYKIQQSEENLKNTSLFNDVTITYEPDTISDMTTLCMLEEQVLMNPTHNTGDKILFYTLKVDVSERWYYWPLIGIKLEDRNLSSWLKDMDWNKITFDAGIKIDNVWGLNHTLTLSGRFGFEKGFKFSYNDISLDPKGEHSFSIGGYSRFNKTINIMCEDNRPVFIKSYNNYLEKSSGGSITYIYRPEIRVHHKVSLEYNYRRLSDSMLINNSCYYGSEALKNHEYTFKYRFSFDHRNYSIFPTEGYYIGVTAKGTTADNFNFWYGNVIADGHYYHKISNRWFWKSALRLSASFKNRNAYIYDHAIGYDNMNIVGYDLYVIDGQHYGTLNNSIRFLLLPEKRLSLNFLRALSKFYRIPFTVYISADIDMGYVHNKYPTPCNNLQNKYLMGAGIGIDILTYYDIVFNVTYDYTLSKGGGFFFGLRAPIF